MMPSSGSEWMKAARRGEIEGEEKKREKKMMTAEKEREEEREREMEEISSILMSPNIIGPEASQHIIQEYLRRRGYVDSSTSIPDLQTSNSQGYVKPPADENGFAAAKKQTRSPKATAAITNETKKKTEIAESSNNSRRKKKAGKVISLAEAAKGSVVFRQGPSHVDDN
ncbi:uncharacterized protein A4U43_C03F27610 [Asparagus officinalis]|uniref:Uncharacterized protein n=1 Tax=Asparagus officinalis TaxID=4686 RepID=A0A5P1FHP8_ASPOF|nr:uncharacterized protein A4U43_C03F27610 [Asparagus officinalis]